MPYYRDRRGNKAYKGYKGLFICMATRAVHLEAVRNQSQISRGVKIIARSGILFPLSPPILEVFKKQG
uniref:SFRICE_013756 n=1 Tax=Spodoptera frugiperda TaxID=7108 RepID=A0A2H1W8P5_SPOFR